MGSGDGLVTQGPKDEMPKIPKGQTVMKGRRITGEEFDYFPRETAMIELLSAERDAIYASTTVFAV
jgi:hypothetical protein